jgi:hypothetical protein
MQKENCLNRGIIKQKDYLMKGEPMDTYEMHLHGQAELLQAMGHLRAAKLFLYNATAGDYLEHTKLCEAIDKIMDNVEEMIE